MISGKSNGCNHLLKKNVHIGFSQQSGKPKSGGALPLEVQKDECKMRNCGVRDADCPFYDCSTY